MDPRQRMAGLHVQQRTLASSKETIPTKNASQQCSLSNVRVGFLRRVSTGGARPDGLKRLETAFRPKNRRARGPWVYGSMGL